MMTIYKWENGGLRESPNFVPNCWINLVEPTTTELESVLGFSGGIIPRDFLTDPLDRDERPRFDYDDGVTMLLIHVPYMVDDDDVVPYRTVPIGIILLSDMVVTVCNVQTPVTAAFLDQIRRVCPPSDRCRFAFRLLWHGGVLFLRYLHDLHQRTDALEDEIHESISNEILLKFLNIEKALVYFTTSLKADTIALARANTSRQLQLSEDDRDQLEDAMVEYEQALETATIHANILNGTLDAFASIINNNMNNVMKYLTAVTILLAVPTLIASIYGMNIALPFQATHHAFGFVMGISAVLAAIIGAVFYILSRKNKF
ncbi:MAG: magnesium transporter CorA family protein [Kiritimatiellae bacterium]|nr:magnesium transporter CorA family protein [Kiritimatiellia bacterium]MBR4522979.1 magnesium transporter CorA family protein [Kiritimatiellia bacterium]